METQNFQPLGSSAKKGGYLFHPIVDFLGMGGAAFIVFLYFYYLVPGADTVGWAALAALLAHFINHPHFALSYQIFYKDIRRKLKPGSSPSKLWLRYWLSGVVVPASIFGFMVWCLWMKDGKTLALTVNAMFFLVGWHYVKQGYGCLMVYCHLNRNYPSHWAKKLLLLNGLICWGYAWLNSNRYEYFNQFWGLQYGSFKVPATYLQSFKWASCVTGGLVAVYLLWLLWQSRGKASFPYIGVIAYVSAIYPWTVFPHLDPAYALFIPLFHSLQYLVISTKYQSNVLIEQRAEVKLADQSKPSELKEFFSNRISFFVCTIVIGFLIFWGIPEGIQKHTAINSIFNYKVSAALFCFWIFINIHHYFMDSVIWRRENKETKKFLFN